MKTAIEVEHLGKYFGEIKAVDDISFTVNKGEVLGFLGPNGAGKSTTMKMLTCFITPDFGRAKIHGYNILTQPIEVRKCLGYLPENSPAYEDMTVSDYLNFVASVRGLDKLQKKQQIDRVYSMVKIADVKDQVIGTLSKGYKHRLGFAQAILHDPEVLIMDEPTDGLDPNQKYEVRQLIKQMAKDKVIILSTHILEEVDEVCTRAIIISKGKIVADGTPSQLRERSSFHGMVELSLDPKIQQTAYDFFKNQSLIEKVEKAETAEGLIYINLFPKEEENFLNQVIEICKSHSWKIQKISLNPGNLQEVFRKITRGD